MRIAVCMHGQLRTGILAFPNIRHFFGNLFDSCDFFIHTWNLNSYRNVMAMNIGTRPPEKVSKSDLISYEMMYAAKKFMVQNQEEFLTPLRQQYGHIGELINLYHSFYYSVKLKKEYEDLHNFKYDVVLRLRPDILFPLDRFLEKDLEQYYQDTTKIYSNANDDYYHIASSTNMDISADFYYTMEIPNWRHWPIDSYSKYLKLKNIDFVPLNDLRFTVLRPESAYMNVVHEYDQIVIFNAHVYDNIFYSTHDLGKFYINNNNPNWKNEMWAIFEKVLGKLVTEKLRTTLEL